MLRLSPKPGYDGYMTDKPKLHVIQGTPAPDTPVEQARERIRKMPKPATMIQCHRCGSREVMVTKIGMVLKNGKAIGGTPQILCASCHRGGERVVLC
jgi:hypothetical protein